MAIEKRSAKAAVIMREHLYTYDSSNGVYIIHLVVLLTINWAFTTYLCDLVGLPI